MEPLPFIDTHTVVADVVPDLAWEATRASFDRPMTGLVARYARLVRVEGNRAFVVDRAEPPVLLGLTGAHRFSRYALTFTFRQVGARRTEISAHTNAVFPGVAGQVYQTLVIRSRAHRVLTRALLHRIARRASRG